MKKKIYTTPTLSVDEYEFVLTTAVSGNQINSVSSNLGDDSFTISSTGGNGTGNSASRANNRGIWDED